MDWHLLLSAGGTLVSILTALIANRARADIAELKLFVVERLAQSEKEQTQAADETYVRKDVLEARLIAR